MERTSPRLVIRLADGSERVVDLREGRMNVGRAPDAGIRLALPEVSGHHAELRWDGTQLSMRDLSSTNGTLVNDGRLTGWTVLRDGDRIRWGPVTAGVVLSAPAPAPAKLEPVPPGRAGPRPSAKRIFISHASEDKRRARMVAGILRRQGWEPWIDESGILGGSSWAASIQQALKASSVVVLLITANSVAKEWVLDEIVAARNLRVPIIPAVLEEVRLPDELRFMLQRTQFVNISALTSTDSDNQHNRNFAAQRLDNAILGVLERQGRLNPDRVRMRIGRVLGWLGAFLLLGGFTGFVFMALRQSDPAASPVPVFIPWGVFIVGMIIAGSGAAMVRSGRAKGL